MEPSALAERVDVSTAAGPVPRWVCHECGSVMKDPMPERCTGCLRLLMAAPNGKPILHLTESMKVPNFAELETSPEFAKLAEASPREQKKMIEAARKLAEEQADG